MAKEDIKIVQGMKKKDFLLIMDSLNFKLGYSYNYDKKEKDNNESMFFDSNKNLLVYADFFGEKLNQCLLLGETKTEDDKLKLSIDGCIFMNELEFIVDAKKDLGKFLNFLNDNKIETVPFSKQYRELPINYADYEKLTMQLNINDKVSFLSQKQISYYKVINSSDEIKQIYNFNNDEKLIKKMTAKNLAFIEAYNANNSASMQV